MAVKKAEVNMTTINDSIQSINSQNISSNMTVYNNQIKSTPGLTDFNKIDKSQLLNESLLNQNISSINRSSYSVERVGQNKNSRHPFMTPQRPKNETKNKKIVLKPN